MPDSGAGAFHRVLHAATNFAGGSGAHAPLGAYLAFYNARRPHQSLDGATPDVIYFAGLPQERLAA